MPIIEGDYRTARGPGKFDSDLDELIWGISLDGGADEEAGESETTGWYGLMRDGAGILQSILDRGETVTKAEAALLKRAAGVILSEDSQGFVSVDIVQKKRTLDRRWNEIVAEVDEAEGEGEGDGW